MGKGTCESGLTAIQVPFFLIMYSDYLMERENIQTIENENSFFTFEYDGEFLGVPDLYIRPTYRCTSEFKKIITQICKVADSLRCKKVIGKVFKGANGANYALNIYLKIGFDISYEDEQTIYLVSSIEKLKRFT